MIEAIRKSHLLITRGQSDEALDILAWFLSQEEIDSHNHEEGLEGWPAERQDNE